MRFQYADYWDIHHRKSTRLPNRNYAADGMYFVTICTIERECLLGKILNGKMILNEFGRFAEAALTWIPKQYTYVKLDAHVVMPNHVHAILCLSDEGHCEDAARRGGSRTAPTTTHIPSRPRKSLGRLVGVFKTVSTKWINVMRDAPGEPIWQRNYHDRIIRNADELYRVRQYIAENPQKWSEKDMAV